MARNITQEHLDAVSNSVDTTPAVFLDVGVEATVSIKPMLPSSVMYTAEFDFGEKPEEIIRVDDTSAENESSTGESSKSVDDGQDLSTCPTPGNKSNIHGIKTLKSIKESLLSELQPKSKTTKNLSSLMRKDQSSSIGKNSKALSLEKANGATLNNTAAKKSAYVAKIPGRARKSIITNPLLRN